MSQQGDVKDLAEETARIAGSFVYPVRSLLSAIQAQAAAQGIPSASTPGPNSRGEHAHVTAGEQGVIIGDVEGDAGAYIVPFGVLGFNSILR